MDKNKESNMLKSFTYKTIETEMFGHPITLEANGVIDESGNAMITELFHCLDNTKYSQPLDDIIKSVFLRGLLENKIKEQMQCEIQICQPAQPQ